MKNINLNASSISISAYSNRTILVNIDIENYLLLDILDDIDEEGIISFLEDKGYIVTK